MQGRYDALMASRYLYTAASSSMGTADTARVDGGSPASAAASAAAAAAPPAAGPSGHAMPFWESTHRGPGDDDGFEVPTMTREVAAKVTRGFVAIGRVRDVVKALCKALQAMGAEVRLLCASPFRFLP